MQDSKWLKSLAPKIIWSLVFGVAVYLGLSVWALGGRNELGNFRWELFPGLLLLATGNYVLRFGKWQYYLRILRLSVPWRDSLVIFLSGFALSITPGKLGEVVRSYFLKQGFAAPITKTAPIVLADRLTDLLSLVILSAAGAVSYHYGRTVVWGLALVVAVLFVVITVRPLAERVLGLMGRLPGVSSQRLGHLQSSYEASVTLLEWRRIGLPLVLSIVAWGLEAIGLYVTFIGLGVHQGVLAAIFIYAFSTVVGAVTMLPGGLGATEGSITGLMNLLGVSVATGALAAIIIRAATLWFAVAIGAVALVLATRRYTRNA